MKTFDFWILHVYFRLDGVHVVFGKIKGKASKTTVKSIEALGSPDGTPQKRVIIDHCNCGN